MTPEDLCKATDALAFAASGSGNPQELERLAAGLRAMADAEPVEYQILILGQRWAHCAKHIYESSSDKSIVRALYTAPQRPQWQGLTEDEKAKFVADIVGYGVDFAVPLFATVEAIESALRAKNGGA